MQRAHGPKKKKSRMRSSKRVQERHEREEEAERTKVHPVLYVKCDWNGLGAEQKEANEALEVVIDKMRANEKGFTRHAIQEALERVHVLLRQAAEVGGGEQEDQTLRLVTTAIEQAEVHARAQPWNDAERQAYVDQQANKALQLAKDRNQREKEKLRSRLAALEASEVQASAAVTSVSEEEPQEEQQAAGEAAPSKKRKAEDDKPKKKKANKPKPPQYLEDGRVDSRTPHQKAAETRAKKKQFVEELETENKTLREKAAIALFEFARARFNAGLLDQADMTAIDKVTLAFGRNSAAATEL